MFLLMSFFLSPLSCLNSPRRKSGSFSLYFIVDHPIILAPEIDLCPPLPKSRRLTLFAWESSSSHRFYVSRTWFLWEKVSLHGFHTPYRRGSGIYDPPHLLVAPPLMITNDRRLGYFFVFLFIRSRHAYGSFSDALFSAAAASPASGRKQFC